MENFTGNAANCKRSGRNPTGSEGNSTRREGNLIGAVETAQPVEDAPDLADVIAQIPEQPQILAKEAPRA